MTFLQFTPFPYMIYYPIAILVGRVDLMSAAKIFLQSLAVLGFWYYIVMKVWKKGLKNYAAVGI